MQFDDICKLKVGEVFFECEYGMNLRARVTEAPTVGTVTFQNETKERRTVKFEAVNTETNNTISYLVTEGMGAYGPRLYTHPQYGYVKDNAFRMPLLGGEDIVQPFGSQD